MTRARAGLGGTFLLAGALHFLAPRTYMAIMPRYLPAHRALVYASGVAEIAGGVAIMHPRTRRIGGLLSVATLVAVFPANVYMALHPHRYPVPGGRVALYLRLPLQLLFIAWARAAASVSSKT
jgi:uncharacterized membrane protein